MKTLQFVNAVEPGVAEVLSPFCGQRAQIHLSSTPGCARRIALFPVEGSQVMRIPQLGYLLEALAFGVCGIAGFALLLMPLLRVS